MFIDHKDLKAIIMMLTQKKIIKVVMMIKYYKHLIGLQLIHMKQMLLKYVKKKDINYNKIQYYNNKYKK